MIFDRRTNWLYDGPDDSDWSDIARKMGQRIAYLRRLARRNVLDINIGFSTGNYGSSPFNPHRDLHFLDFPAPAQSPSIPLSSVNRAKLVSELDVGLRSRIGNPPAVNGLAPARWYRSARDLGCQACGLEKSDQ